MVESNIQLSFWRLHKLLFVSFLFHFLLFTCVSGVILTPNVLRASKISRPRRFMDAESFRGRAKNVKIVID